MLTVFGDSHTSGEEERVVAGEDDPDGKSGADAAVSSRLRTPVATDDDLRSEDESTANDRDDPIPSHESPGSVREEGLDGTGVERIEEREGSEVSRLGKGGPEAKVVDEEVLNEVLSLACFGWSEGVG